MSRTQADQVALAVVNVGWPSETAAKGPLESRTACRTLILSEGITPPCVALIRQEDERIGYAAILCCVVGLAALGGLVWWSFV